jgi:hypothetical protein
MGAEEDGDRDLFTEMSNWTPWAPQPEFNQAPVPPIAIRVAQSVRERGGGKKNIGTESLRHGCQGPRFRTAGT